MTTQPKSNCCGAKVDFFSPDVYSYAICSKCKKDCAEQYAQDTKPLSEAIEEIQRGMDEKKSKIVDMIERMEKKCDRLEELGARPSINWYKSLIRAVGEELINSINYPDLNPYKVKEIKEDLEEKLEAIINEISK